MSYPGRRRVLFLTAVLPLFLIAPELNARLGSQNSPPRPAKQKDPGNYDVVLETSQAGGGSTWTYTISKTTPGTKDLGHFIVNFNNCGEESPALAHIVSATVDRVDWLSHLEASEGKTGCAVDSTNFVKFDNLPPADTHVIQFTLDDIYPTVDTTGWLKAGTIVHQKAHARPWLQRLSPHDGHGRGRSLAGAPDDDINTYMRTFGFDYTENPNCTGGYGGHIDGVHGAVDLDSFLNRYVFRFDIHIDPVIDGDRCSSGTVDRQRNEMKSITNNSTWAKVQGNWDEWQILEWKFKLPAGFQPTQNFVTSTRSRRRTARTTADPVITITPRAASSGSNRRIQIIHSVDGANTGKGTIVDNIPLSDFENEWVQVREEDSLHARWVLLREDHPHQRRKGAGGFQGRAHRHVADRKLVHPEQVRDLPESGRRTVGPGLPWARVRC